MERLMTRGTSPAGMPGIAPGFWHVLYQAHSALDRFGLVQQESTVHAYSWHSSSE